MLPILQDTKSKSELKEEKWDWFKQWSRGSTWACWMSDHSFFDDFRDWWDKWDCNCNRKTFPDTVRTERVSFRRSEKTVPRTLPPVRNGSRARRWRASLSHCAFDNRRNRWRNCSWMSVMPICRGSRCQSAIFDRQRLTFRFWWLWKRARDWEEYADCEPQSCWVERICGCLQRPGGRPDAVGWIQLVALHLPVDWRRWNPCCSGTREFGRCEVGGPEWRNPNGDWVIATRIADASSSIPPAHWLICSRLMRKKWRPEAVRARKANGWNRAALLPGRSSSSMESCEKVPARTGTASSLSWIRFSVCAVVGTCNPDVLSYVRLCRYFSIIH